MTNALLPARLARGKTWFGLRAATTTATPTSMAPNMFTLYNHGNQFFTPIQALLTSALSAPPYQHSYQEAFLPVTNKQLLHICHCRRTVVAAPLAPSRLPRH